MQNQTDNVMNEAFEVTPPPIQAAQAPRPPVAQGRREFYDDPRRKSPVLALVLSLMPGLGQVYVGYYNQGFINTHERFFNNLDLKSFPFTGNVGG